MAEVFRCPMCEFTYETDCNDVMTKVRNEHMYKAHFEPLVNLPLAEWPNLVPAPLGKPCCDDTKEVSNGN
jgi:hypothetical protein